MFEINAAGVIQDIPFRLSPFHNERPNDTDINLLVIHNISLPPAEFGGSYIDDFFLGKIDYTRHPYFETLRDKKVSSHLLIDRLGHVIQYVPLTKRAWHAGISSFHGRDNCNDFSIGVELEGSDDIPFTEPQYRQLVRLTRDLMRWYPITKEAIVGHEAIAPGRKSDPGPAFNWTYYFTLLHEST